MNDPEGEAEAVAPLTLGQGIENMTRFHVARRTAAIHGDDFLEAIGVEPGRERGRLVCPAHGSGMSKTLAYMVKPDGFVILTCFAGCTYDDIRKAAGYG